MPRILIKASPGLDLYMFWSTVVDAPLHIGTRTETAEHLAQAGDFTSVTAEAALTLADRNGTNSTEGLGHWNDTNGLIVDQRAWLSRENFASFMQAYYCGLPVDKYLLIFDQVRTNRVPQRRLPALERPKSMPRFTLSIASEELVRYLTEYYTLEATTTFDTNPLPEAKHWDAAWVGLLEGAVTTVNDEDLVHDQQTGDTVILTVARSTPAHRSTTITAAHLADPGTVLATITYRKSPAPLERRPDVGTVAGVAADATHALLTVLQALNTDTNQT